MGQSEAQDSASRDGSRRFPENEGEISLLKPRVGLAWSSGVEGEASQLSTKGMILPSPILVETCVHSGLLLLVFC